MRSKKSAMSDQASALAARAGAAGQQAKAQALTQASELSERVGPALADARTQARTQAGELGERVGPAVAEARERLAPVAEDAKTRLADLAETVATKLDESLPDEHTPQAVKERSTKSGGKLKKLFLLVGLGAVAAAVVKKVKGGSEPQWQSAAPPAPAPRPTPADDAAGGSPDEAAADSAENPHQPTNPDDPAEKVEINKD